MMAASAAMIPASMLSRAIRRQLEYPHSVPLLAQTRWRETNVHKLSMHEQPDANGDGDENGRLRRETEPAFLAEEKK